MTTRTLCLLIVEDVEDHALLIVREVAREGFAVDYHRVDTKEDLAEALKDARWDAIISDFRLPGFNALDALHAVQERGLDVPFILVSGVIGEEMAAEVMKAGAHGYIMKGNYSRLVPTLERELKEAAVRRERRETAVNLTQYREELEKAVREKSARLIELTTGLESEMQRRRKAEEHLAVCRARLATCWMQLQRLSHQLGALRKHVRHQQGLGHRANRGGST